MPNDLSPKDLRNLWQSQERENVTITLEEIRLRAARFRAADLVAKFPGRGRTPNRVVSRGAPLFARLGSSGTRPADCGCGLYHWIQLRWRGTERSLPADADTRSSVEFHRLELERRRYALRTVWRWYLSPLVPGLADIFAVAATKRGVNAR